jgi:hypothetical protein
MDTRLASTPKDSGFRSFAEFYPFYLSEHRNPVSRMLHYLGTWGTVSCLIALAVTGEPVWLLAGALSGYTFAWIGHFFFEHNRPAANSGSVSTTDRHLVR